MPAPFDIVGCRYTNLTVISRAGRDKHGQVLWLCTCDCGNETTVTTHMLRSGHTASCGCHKRRHLKSLIGMTFGSWTVLSIVQRTGPGNPRLTCKCECGTIRNVEAGDIKRNISTSCGCKKGHLISKRHTLHGHTQRGKNSITFQTWSCMLERCNRSDSANFQNYGGRGISICDEWKSFEAFLADMGERPGRQYTIERVNNNEGYNKHNCVWATMIEQARNKRTNRLIDIDGTTRTLAGWCEFYNIGRSCVDGRLRRGMDPVAALTAPLQPRNKRRAKTSDALAVGSSLTDPC